MKNVCDKSPGYPGYDGTTLLDVKTKSMRTYIRYQYMKTYNYVTTDNEKVMVVIQILYKNLWFEILKK